MDKVTLRSNPVAQLKLLKNSMFIDKYVFVDELIQNAQRAGATQVDIVVDVNDICVTNNGAVLDDFQKLFNIAESGWESEEVKKEMPFGIGFFSVVLVADIIEIHSGDKMLVFDVPKMLSGDINLETVTQDNIDGFSVTLKNAVKNIHVYELANRVKEAGQYNLDITVTYNGIEIEKKDLIEHTDDPHEIVIDNDNMKGCLNFSDISGSEISIFYKGRKITDEFFPYVIGKIHISNNVLNLRAPDRKAIIHDDKYYEFKDTVKELLSAKLLDIIKEYNNIENYENAILRYVKTGELAKLIRLPFVEKAEDFDILNNLIIKTQEGHSEPHPCIPVSQTEEVVTEVVDPHILKDIPEYVEKGFYESKGFYTPPTEITRGGEFLRDPKDIPKTFYVNIKELKEYGEEVHKLKHLGVPIVIIRNKVEEEVANFMGLQSIGKMGKVDSNVVVTFKKYNLTADTKRALELFQMIGNRFDMIFQIGQFEKAETHVFISALNAARIVPLAELPTFAKGQDNTILVDIRNIEDSVEGLHEADEYGCTKFLLACSWELSKIINVCDSRLSVEEIMREIIETLLSF